jgi:hypothetical protein
VTETGTLLNRQQWASQRATMSSAAGSNGFM